MRQVSIRGFETHHDPRKRCLQRRTGGFCGRRRPDILVALQWVVQHRCPMALVLHLWCRSRRSGLGTWSVGVLAERLDEVSLLVMTAKKTETRKSET